MGLGVMSRLAAALPPLPPACCRCRRCCPQLSEWSLRKASAAALDSLSLVFGDELLPVLLPRLQVLPVLLPVLQTPAATVCCCCYY